MSDKSEALRLLFGDGDGDGMEQDVRFIFRTLPPVTAVNFAVVIGFAPEPWIATACAGAFVANMAVHLVLEKLTGRGPGAVIILVNIGIFATTVLLTGRETPGWLLYIPPVVAAVLVARRSTRIAFLILINGTCLVTNLLNDASPMLTTAIAVFLGGVTLLLLRFHGHLERQREIIEQERRRSDLLLDALLPHSIAERIKAGETSIAERHENVAILFADIVGFTPLSEKLEPEEVVRFLDLLFVRFDELIEARGVEKIKTMGDAYMVASGLDGADAHVEHLAGLARDLLDAITAFNESQGTSLKLRIGMHVGPAVAGIVGMRRFVYDVWGDTVNTAARMESHGLAGEIQVTRSVRDALGDTYEFESRGTIEVKGKGQMETWLLRHGARESRAQVERDGPGSIAAPNRSGT